MKKYETETIRNVGMFSHGGEGKTSIVETVLFLAGENTRLGRVDDGTSLMDYEPEEMERKASISASVACFDWNKYKINLIDTPGDDNFIYDAKLCMRVVDAAVVVVSAVSGVRVQTEKVWEYANEFAIPSCLFINKMDRERADFAQDPGGPAKELRRQEHRAHPTAHRPGREFQGDHRPHRHEGVSVQRRSVRGILAGRHSRGNGG